MIQVTSYADERQLAYCAFCGGKTDTRDHCPSRVFLEPPYPENLPVVPACRRCNTRFSLDEQYLACLVACVVAGSTEPEMIRRPKICRILAESPGLRARIEKNRIASAGGVVFAPEQDRVCAVVTKLAQGHALYELHEPRPEEPDEVRFVPVHSLTDSAREEFEFPQSARVWPEVGSRAMQRLVIQDSTVGSPWIIVQPGLYRYHAAPVPGTTIRIVIGEYLACYVEWAD